MQHLLQYLLLRIVLRIQYKNLPIIFYLCHSCSLILLILQKEKSKYIIQPFCYLLCPGSFVLCSNYAFLHVPKKGFVYRMPVLLQKSKRNLQAVSSYKQRLHIACWGKCPNPLFQHFLMLATHSS